jgi:protein-S-isoprenylcysteine O-methyltransferase Ste14
MLNILGFSALLLFFVLLIGRIAVMGRRGVRALVLGAKDKKEYAFFALYILLTYIIAANTFPLPMPAVLNRFFWDADGFRWVGAALAFIGLAGFAVCLISFGNSFRVGIDTQSPDKLVTGGIYAYSRNPMYTSFDVFFLGLFLLFPNTAVLLVFLVAAVALNNQIRKEEMFLKSHYGADYKRYREKVRRYF